VGADQFARLGAVLLGGAFEPVQRGRQAARQAGTAEQVEFAQRELVARLPGAGAPDNA
jgi:hypothetical protein